MGHISSTEPRVRTRYTVAFHYPGALFSEDVTKTIDDDRLETVLAAAPTETEGTYFVKDGWYAFTVRAVREKRYTADDGEVQWVSLGQPTRLFRMVVGEKVHVDSLPDDDQYRILRSNIRSNSSDGFGVRTRAGNWQIASDYDIVLSPSEVTRR